MYYRLLIAFVLISLGVFVTANAQITNLTINGVSNNFTMVSGGPLAWEMNIPNATTVTGEIWFDVNTNGTIDPGTDLLYISFTQTDGDTIGNDGPGDMDGLLNGHLLFSISGELGLAPGKYILRFTQNSSVVSEAGTVTPLTTVSHSISGHITPPSGQSAQWILVDMTQQNGEDGHKKSWDAYTDASGNYTIQMDADTSGNPWRVHLGIGENNNPFPPYLLSPSDYYTLTISAASYTGIDFSFVMPAAKVTGVVRDELGNPLSDYHMFITDHEQYYGKTDNSGSFQIGFPPVVLPMQSGLCVEAALNGNYVTGATLNARRSLPMINSGDNIYRELVVFSANAHITGHVLINGGAPNISIQIHAFNYDTAEAITMASSVDGSFDIPVSNQVYSYRVFAAARDLMGSEVIAHAGNAGVVINLTRTVGVVEQNPAMPNNFSLNQNYPNPFNPVTTITYQLPTQSHVTLKIFDVLGREVLTPLNTTEQPGEKSINIDASGLPSGIYFYRLDATSISDPLKHFSQTRKMILIK